MDAVIHDHGVKLEGMASVTAVHAAVTDMLCNVTTIVLSSVLLYYTCIETNYNDATPITHFLV